MGKVGGSVVVERSDPQQPGPLTTGETLRPSRERQEGDESPQVSPARLLFGGGGG